MKKYIISTLLVLSGIFIGCSSNPNTGEVVTAAPTNYKTELLEDRIKLITYVDEENGNVVYITYDISYSPGNQLKAMGITSQPIRE